MWSALREISFIAALRLRSRPELLPIFLSRSLTHLRAKIAAFIARLRGTRRLCRSLPAASPALSASVALRPVRRDTEDQYRRS